MLGILKRVSILALFLGSLSFSGSSQVVGSPDATVERMGHCLLYRAHETSYITNFGNELALKFAEPAYGKLSLFVGYRFKRKKDK